MTGTKRNEEDERSAGERGRSLRLVPPTQSAVRPPADEKLRKLLEEFKRPTGNSKPPADELPPAA